MLKTVFFGTPDAAVPFLEQLNALTQVALVVTKPDSPAGRGLRLQPCPVKKRALELGLPVISPEIFKDSVAQIAALKADFGFAVAYGKIFKKPALEAFKHGIINIHFSLLPKYRGAAPIQQALFDGQTKTGVSAFWIDEGLDTGLLAAQTAIDILPQDDEISLFDKLTRAAQADFAGIVKDLEAGRITKTPQKGEPSFAPVIDKKDTVVNFRTMTAAKINNLTRGLAGGIPAYAKAQTPKGETVQLLKTTLKPMPQAPKLHPGAFIAVERGIGFFVQCLEGVLFIETLRPAGKNKMPAWDYYNGKKPQAGDIMFL